MKNFLKAACLTLAMSLSGVAVSQAATKVPTAGYPAFAWGGDVSALNRITDGTYCYMGDNGSSSKATITYYPSTAYNTTTGALTAGSSATTLPALLQSFNFDAVRLRVWVNPKSTLAQNGFTYAYDGGTSTVLPTYGYCDQADLVNLATKLAPYGQRVMIVFHLSDTWADPALQFIPEAWKTAANINTLANLAKAHVTSVLQALHSANINVAWVQIGNETNTGMMDMAMPSSSGGQLGTYTTGCGIWSSTTDATSYSNFVTVWNACADAARAVYPDVKTVLHLANGQSWSDIKWTCDILKKGGFFTSGKCDYVGLSLYPDDMSTTTTTGMTSRCTSTVTTINNLYSNYGVRSLICEIGFRNDYTTSSGSDLNGYVKKCNLDLYSAMSSFAPAAKNTGYCDGIFYWEPEVDHLDGYPYGAMVGTAYASNDWNRNKLMPNAFWWYVKNNTTANMSSLTDFTVSGGGSGEGPEVPVTGDPLYIVWGGSWDVDAPTRMNYDSSTGLYHYTFTTNDDAYVALSTGIGASSGNDTDGWTEGNWSKGSLWNTEGVINGRMQTYGVATGSWDGGFALPEKGTWTAIVNMAKGVFTFYRSGYTRSEYQETPAEGHSVQLYSGTASGINGLASGATAAFTELDGTNGNVYYLKVSSIKATWANFHFVVDGTHMHPYEDSNTYGLISVTVSSNSVTASSNNNEAKSTTSWSYWLDNSATVSTVSTNLYFWYNVQNNKWSLNSSYTPTSITKTNLSTIVGYTDTTVTPYDYSFTYNNGLTDFDEVFAYMADGSLGQWPGTRMDYNAATGLWSLEYRAINQWSTNTNITFNNGASTATEYTDPNKAKFQNGYQYGEGAIVTHAPIYVYGDLSADGQYVGWDESKAVEMTYNKSTDSYSITLDLLNVNDPRVQFSLGTGSWSNINSQNLLPVSEAVASGQSILIALDAAESEEGEQSTWFPNPGMWTVNITLDEDGQGGILTATCNNAVTCYQDSGYTPLYIYGTKDASSDVYRWLMSTDDGVNYYVTGHVIPAWLKVKVHDWDWTTVYGTANKTDGLALPGNGLKAYLDNTSALDQSSEVGDVWLDWSTSLPAATYIWFNTGNYAMCVTAQGPGEISSSWADVDPLFLYQDGSKVLEFTYHEDTYLYEAVHNFNASDLSFGITFDGTTYLGACDLNNQAVEGLEDAVTSKLHNAGYDNGQINLPYEGMWSIVVNTHTMTVNACYLGVQELADIPGVEGTPANPTHTVQFYAASANNFAVGSTTALGNGGTATLTAVTGTNNQVYYAQVQTSSSGAAKFLFKVDGEYYGTGTGSSSSASMTVSNKNTSYWVAKSNAKSGTAEKIVQSAIATDYFSLTPSQTSKTLTYTYVFYNVTTGKWWFGSNSKNTNSAPTSTTIDASYVTTNTGWTTSEFSSIPAVAPVEGKTATHLTASYNNGASDWENVYAQIYYWDGEDQVELNGPWPGQRLVDPEDGIYSVDLWTYEDLSGKELYVIYSNGCDFTAEQQFTAGRSYGAPAGLFLSGGADGDWADYEMEANADGTYTVTLPEGAFYGMWEDNGFKFKVATADYSHWYGAYGVAVGKTVELTEGVANTQTYSSHIVDATGDGKNAWLESDIWEYNTITFDPATKTLSVSGPKVLYIANDDNNWLGLLPTGNSTSTGKNDENSFCAPRRSLDLNDGDNRASLEPESVIGGYRFDYDAAASEAANGDVYVLTGVEVETAGTVFSIVDRAGTALYGGIDTAADGQTRAIADNLSAANNWLNTSLNGTETITLEVDIDNPEPDGAGKVTRLTITGGNGGQTTQTFVVDQDAITAPVEYFNVQGMRIVAPGKGRVVIRRQGKNATKVLVK